MNCCFFHKFSWQTPCGRCSFRSLYYSMLITIRANYRVQKTKTLNFYTLWSMQSVAYLSSCIASYFYYSLLLKPSQQFLLRIIFPAPWQNHFLCDQKQGRRLLHLLQIFESILILRSCSLKCFIQRSAQLWCLDASDVETVNTWYTPVNLLLWCRYHPMFRSVFYRTYSPDLIQLFFYRLRLSFWLLRFC